MKKQQEKIDAAHFLSHEMSNTNFLIIFSVKFFVTRWFKA
jgi:hypothetical protein